MLKIMHLPDKIKGFTLIEILVVLVIISVILTFTTLSIGDGGLTRKLEQEAQRLASLLTLASQEAIMQEKELGISFEVEGYHFHEWYEQKWHVLTAPDNIFRPRRFSVGIQAEIRLEGEPIVINEIQSNLPQLLLLSSGEFTPFEIILTAESDDTLRYWLTGTATGVISIKQDQYD